MKQIFLDLSEAKAIGDTLCSTPVIKKLYNSYNSKIFVISEHIELFKNNPYVHKCYKPNSLNLDFIKNNTIYHNSFTGIGKKNERGVEYKHSTIDIRQFHAISLGFMLSNDEMECDFIPDEFEPIPNLPEKYVLIHPVQNWPSRTWSADKWCELTEMLNKQGISVVSIGKDSSETGFFNVNKPIFNFHIEHGLNLMNKTSLSQAWHLIEKSMGFITMDSGLLHLAGTTDANIIYLGSSIKPEFRMPYRQGNQTYKSFYIAGTCSLTCASNMKHGVKEWGNIQGVPPLIGCLENKPTFECHPSVLQVFDKIIEINYESTNNV
jgi:ADP-heptose:LPS heptosyltransferase